jgi:hypothetical protein
MNNLILNIYNKILNPSKYIVDIGASFGAECDPVYQFLIKNEYNGLCIEGNTIKSNELKKKTKFNIYNGYITPNNILSIFKQYNVPIYIDILKIDIDGFDLEIIRKILTIYKPKIIIAEINEKIPPPIKFEVLYKEDYNWDESHFFGFSIASGEKVMSDNNYKILSIYDINNIICVNSELSEIIGLSEYIDINKIYMDGYINNIKRKDFYWNNNVNYWLNIKDKDILKNEITNYFVNVNDRSKLLNKKKIKDIDFIIDY